MERDRYTTMDVQLEAAFSVIGDGVVAGWQVQANHPQTGVYTSGSIWITAGKGHIGSIAAETLSSRRLSGLTAGSEATPGIYYIHAAVNDFTRINKDVSFFAAETIYDDSESLLLAKVTISGTGASDIEIDNTVRRSIGFSGAMLAGLLAHKHGSDGISKIDLGSEVRGVLGGDNLSDVEAARITGGTINPERFVLSHFDLLEAGTITHAELDALVAFLQKANKKLFGDITTSNLCQIAVTAKEINESVDKYFRNMITVVPGLGTDKFYNELSRIEPETIIDKSLFNYTTNEPTQPTYLIGTTTYTFRDDAAIGYFGPDGYIEGVPTTETVSLDFAIDTYAEFDAGRHSPDYISLEEDPDVTGAAIVKLIAGGADYLLYTTSLTPSLTPPSSNNSVDTMPSAGYVNYPAAWSSVMENTNTYTVDVDGAPLLDETDPKWLLMLRFGYSPGNGGDADPPVMSDPKLHYILDYADATKSDYWDWSTVQSLQFRFSGTGETYAVDGNWNILLEDSLGNTHSEAFLTDGNHYYSTVIAIDISAISAPFNPAAVKKITIYNTDTNYEVTASTADTKAIPWAANIESISLGGLTFFSSVDSNNTIDQLYFAVPEEAVATFNGNAIEWEVSEPSDSTVRLQIKTVDASATVTDGFVLLQNKSWDNAGNEYSNRIAGRESGALMTTEPAGTHVEIRAILQPSSDGLSTPELYSIRMAYTVAGELKYLVWDSTDGWELDIANSITNIHEDALTLELESTADVSSYVFGQSASASLYKSAVQDETDGSLLPLVPGQSAQGLGKAYAVRRMADGNLLVADTFNHRIVKMNRTDGNDEFVLAGSVAPNISGDPLEVHSVFFNRATSMLWMNFSHIVTTGNLDISKWKFVTSGAIRLLTSTASEPLSISSNGVSGSPASGSSTIGIELNSVDSAFLLANPSAQLLVDEDTTESSVATGKNLLATTIARANIFYRSEISFPVDLWLDDSENIAIAQAIDVESPSSAFRILKIDADDMGGDLIYSIDSSSDGKNFSFSKTRLGSIQERLNSSGEYELIIADEGNRRTVRVLADNGQKLWEVAAPSGYAPTCAFIDENDYLYVAYSDRSTSGYIVKYSPTLVSMQEYFTSGMAIPRDIRIVEEKLIISV